MPADWLNAMRLMNIYNPFESMFSSPSMNQQPDMGVEQGMDMNFQPQMEHAATDRFNQLLSQFPQRQDPGMLRKIASIASGIAHGPEAQDEFLNRPFYQQAEDWQRQINPAAQAANLERQSNLNQRQLMHQMFQGNVAQKRAEIAADEVERKRQADSQKLEDAIKLAQSRGDIQAGIEGLRQEGRDRELRERMKRQDEEITLAREKQAATLKEKEVTKQTGLQAIQDKTRETLQALDELLDPKGKLKPEITSAVGASRMAGLQYLPATQTRAGDAAIKRLKSMLIVDLIGEMKAQSRTGATGFGQLNLKELGVLESAASKLDPALDEATFESELKRIREKLNKVLQPTDGLNPTVTVKSGSEKIILTKYARNSRTGEKIKVVSIDGGKTWKSADGKMTFTEGQ